MNKFSLILILALLMPAVALANWHYGYTAGSVSVTPITVAPGDYITVEFEYEVQVTDGSSTSLWAVFFDGANGAFPYDSAGVKLAEELPPTPVYGIYIVTVSESVQIPETAEAGPHSINIFSTAQSYSPYQQFTFAWYGDPPIMITVEEVNPVIEVGIDIKPGSDLNPINQGSNGLIPVAIFSTTEFAATSILPETVSLGGAEVAVRGKGTKYMAHEEDVNGDGLIDLVVQVETEGLDVVGANGEVILTGETADGISIEGTDYVVIVPPES